MFGTATFIGLAFEPRFCRIFTSTTLRDPVQVSETLPTETTFTLLLVDDNEVRQIIWKPLLEHEGYRVLPALNGEEALQILSAELVDLVLLDVKMPGKSGFEVLEILREQHSAEELPVIMMTGLDQDQDIVKGFKLGANDYVDPENVGQDVVLARIRAQLRHRIPVRAEKPKKKGDRNLLGPGTVLDGKYRLDSLIGRGSFGAVYRGTHLQLQRPVAVKVLRTNFGADEVALARFQQEGISLSRLEHPNAVSILDFSVTSDDVAYMVMELLHGYSLDQELKRRGPLSPGRALKIAIPVCNVLAEAHSLGIIHRDIKPQNIFLHHDRRGEVVKVLDFGIAKLVGDQDLQQQLTIEGNSVGTPAYMAPERFTNDPYDGRTDLYSLAVSLYEMLSGRTPFASADGNFFKLIRMHVVEQPKPLNSVKPLLADLLSDVIMSALAKKYTDRPTASEMEAKLQDVLATHPPGSDDDEPLPFGEIRPGAETVEGDTEALPSSDPTIEWQDDAV